MTEPLIFTAKWQTHDERHNMVRKVKCCACFRLVNFLRDGLCLDCRESNPQRACTFIGKRVQHFKESLTA